ncbi:MAG: hypothetical protein ACI4JI_08835 [Ruminiclostridium sp.]
MKKKEKVTLIVGIAVIAVCVLVVLFVLDRFSIVRILPRPVPKQEKVIQLDDLGSADTPEGKTAVVTIFCDDKLTKWDFTSDKDKGIRESDFTALKAATDWISGQAVKYGKDCEFIIPSDENSDLYYEASFTNTVCDSAKALEKAEQWQYIDKNIDSDALKSKYDCRNMIYLLFTNGYDEALKNDDEIIINSYVVNVYDKPNDYPYELACLAMYEGSAGAVPSVIAHEIIHLYGAPDLYAFDAGGMNYATTVAFVDYCRENVPQEIMLSTRDKETGELLPDSITQEITDITAYYIGWLDTAPECVDEYLLVHSQHEYKNSKEKAEQ